MLCVATVPMALRRSHAAEREAWLLTVGRVAIRTIGFQPLGSTLFSGMV